MAKEKTKDKWYTDYIKDNIPELKEKVVVITGTTSGTVNLSFSFIIFQGYWAAVCCIKKQAKNVILLNRPSERNELSFAKLQKIIAEYESETELISIDCDLSSFNSVRKAGEEVNEKTIDCGGIDVLINNAGIEGTNGSSDDNYLRVAQVNHLSHFLLTSLLFDRLEEASENRGEARIVNHSSGVRYFFSFNENDYKPTTTTTTDKENETNKVGKQSKGGALYASTKIANCLFSLEFNKRLKDKESKVIAVTAEPGLSTTPLMMRSLSSKFWSFFNPAQSAQDGSMCLITAAFSKDVKANDLFCPNGFVNIRGKPMKALKEGKSQWVLYNEKNILNENHSKKLWELSIIATGENFLE